MLLFMLRCCIFFFFKQKTAYELRISDWSSDVCSSDLVGTGRNSRKAYFPHIVVDFDLKTAMRAGLVKSLVLDKRSEIGALSHEDLDFNADRDENGNPMLSEGQRIMLRAGLTTLRKHEADFAGLDHYNTPKKPRPN